MRLFSRFRCGLCRDCGQALVEFGPRCGQLGLAGGKDGLHHHQLFAQFVQALGLRTSRRQCRLCPLELRRRFGERARGLLPPLRLSCRKPRGLVRAPSLLCLRQRCLGLLPAALLRLLDAFPRAVFQAGEAVFLFRLPSGAALLELRRGSRRSFGRLGLAGGEGGLSRRQFVAQGVRSLGLSAGFRQCCFCPLDARRRFSERLRRLLPPLCFRLSPPALVRLFNLFPREGFELGDAVLLFGLPRGAAPREIRRGRRRSFGQALFEHGFAGMIELLPRLGQFGIARSEGRL